MRSSLFIALFAIGCGASSSAKNEPSGEGLNADSGAVDSSDDGGGIVTMDTGGGGIALDLAIDPINAIVFVDTGKSVIEGGTQAFTVTEAGVDVTATTTFSVVDTTLGSFTGNVFTSTTDLGTDLGRTTLIDAVAASGKKTQAKVTVVKLRKTKDPVTSARDFFFTVPYKGDPDPKDDVLELTTNIQQIDVAFVTDTTGSMGGAISNIQSNLSTTVIPALKKAIPSVGIAVVDHRDVPTGGYGSTGDWAAKVAAPVTVQTSASALKIVQDAVATYAAGGGSDGPESQIPAMYYTLTGKGFSWGSGSLPDAKKKTGTSGAVYFRSSAVPVIVLTTDVNWHNGVNASSAYSGFTAPDLTMLKAAFKTANAKFVAANIGTESTSSSSPWPDAIDLSDATKSNLAPSAFNGTGKPAGCGSGQCCTGLNGAGKPADAAGGRCRLVFTAGDGTGVSTSIVNAIKALATGSVYDILPVLSNDPTNPDMVDATVFVDRLEAFADDTIGCAGTPRKSNSTMTYDDMIGGIVAGKQTACFRVIPKKNETVPAKDTAQFYRAKINMKGIQPDVEVLDTTPRVDLGDERDILFLVPPTAPIPR
ncbi:MAG: hypothetical protein ACXWUG_02220 [Polyangiales bacterium]